MVVLHVTVQVKPEHVEGILGGCPLRRGAF